MVSRDKRRSHCALRAFDCIKLGEHAFRRAAAAHPYVPAVQEPCSGLMFSLRTTLPTPMRHASPGTERYHALRIAVPAPRSLLTCSFKTPKRFDTADVLQQLYGPYFSTATAAPTESGSMFVLGNHNSGTSVLTRLVMLMGAFQGNLNGAHPASSARTQVGLVQS